MGNFINFDKSFGLQNPLQGSQSSAIIAKRSPTTGDAANPGQYWLNKLTATGFICNGSVSGQYQWSQLAYAPSDTFPTITVNPGPTNLYGTTNIMAGGQLLITGAAVSQTGPGYVSFLPTYFNVSSGGTVTLTSSDNTANSTKLDATNGGTNPAGGMTLIAGTSGMRITCTDPLSGVQINNDTGAAYPTTIGCGTSTGQINIGGGTGNITNIGGDASGITQIISAAASQAAVSLVATDANGGITLSSDSSTANNGVAILQAGTGETASIYVGAGAPAFVARQSSLYINTTGAANTHLYINIDGTNTWTPVASAA